MARNEEGEFELILGNRQLLSVFFIVVVLLGLCFLMGYVIGRNSAPAVNAENVPPPEKSSEPLVIPPASSAASDSTPDVAARSEPPPKTEPQSAPETPALPPPKPPPAAPTETKQAKLPPLPPAPGEQPPAGAYLQLSATLRAEAEAYVDRLREKGFQATMAPVPGQDRYRVLVGPFPDSAAEVQRMRTRLNGEGFPGDGAYPRRY